MKAFNGPNSKEFIAELVDKFRIEAFVLPGDIRDATAKLGTPLADLQAMLSEQFTILLKDYGLPFEGGHVDYFQVSPMAMSTAISYTCKKHCNDTNKTHLGGYSCSNCP